MSSIMNTRVFIAFMVLVSEAHGFMGAVPGVRAIAKGSAAPWRSDRITSRRQCRPIAMSSTVPPQRERQENLSVGDFDRLGILMIKFKLALLYRTTCRSTMGVKGLFILTFWELVDNVYLGLCFSYVHRCSKHLLRTPLNLKLGWLSSNSIISSAVAADFHGASTGSESNELAALENSSANIRIAHIVLDRIFVLCTPPTNYPFWRFRVQIFVQLIYV